jgi:predicted DNA-binding protein
MYGGMYVHAVPQALHFPLQLRGVASMARKKISTTIYITPEQNERLKLLHERTKVPVAVYIREGIDLVLERHQDDLPGQLSLAAANDSKK